MKKIYYYTPVSIFCFSAFIVNCFSQEVQTISNSPNVLKLNIEIIETKKNWDNLRLERTKSREKYLKEKKKGEKTKNDAAFKTFQNIKKLDRQIDSIEVKIRQLRQEHANLFLSSERCKKIVKQMKEAMSVGNGREASNIAMKFREELMNEATERWLSKKIDRLTYLEEIKTIDEIKRALNTVVFVPVKNVTKVHGNN